MATIHDLNLLHALDALLQEGSVTRAAARVHVTTPAMSRALGRLRDAVGDPLLVRAGRAMVLTPAAVALRERAHAIAIEANALLGPAPAAAVAAVERTLAVRASDAIVAVLAAPLCEAARAEAPGLRVRFVAEGDEDAAPLRDGRLDLDVGVIELDAPELRTRLLLRDRYAGLARRGHPITRGRVTARRYAGLAHVGVSRRGRWSGPIDAALDALGLGRVVAATVPDFLSALHAVATSDLVTAVPELLARHAARSLPVRAFTLPVDAPAIAIAMAWHPRVEADPAHRWLRAKVEAIVQRTARRT